MFAFQHGFSRARHRRVVAARGLASMLFASLAGCASNQAAESYAMSANMAQKPSPRVAVEMESDGLPVQTPPPKSIRNSPDDPNEPWSPNYGGVNPSASARPLQEYEPAHKSAPNVPEDLPPDFRKKLVASLNVSD